MKEKLSRYFFYFMLYSIIGWIYEVFLEVVIYHWGYSNRGVLFGPCCVIYGVGALILLFSLQGLKRQSIRLGPVPITPVLVFAAIVVITTVVELIGAPGQPPARRRLFRHHPAASGTAGGRRSVFAVPISLPDHSDLYYLLYTIRIVFDLGVQDEV